MACLGLEPGAAEWKAQANPLCYGGTPTYKKRYMIHYCVLHKVIEFTEKPNAETTVYLERLSTQFLPPPISDAFVSTKGIFLH